MKKTTFIIGLISIFLFACRDNAKLTNQNEVSVEKQDTISDHKAEHEHTVLLNNGKKWAANTETTEGINKMSALVRDFSTNPKLDDCHSLKAKVETEFNTILQKCTMTGEAHNQLHNYLLPMKEIIAKLNSSEIDACRKALAKLKEHLTEYGSYFE